MNEPAAHGRDASALIDLTVAIRPEATIQKIHSKSDIRRAMLCFFNNAKRLNLPDRRISDLATWR